MTRAGSYERMSRDRTGQRAGVERQHTENARLADELAWQVTERYVDNDLSAVNLRKPRKDYLRLLDDIEAGRLDAIVTWHPDRLYRQPSELEHLITVVERNRVLIRTVEAGEIDLTTPSGRLVARQLGAVAKYEGEQKAARWKLSVVTNRKAGKWSNARDRLFGYERDGEVNPEEAERLQWMAEQVLAGRSLSSICNELNDLGVTTTRGNRWGGHALRYLLLNPKIAGYATHMTGPAKGAAREIVGVGQWQPVLDPDLWEKVTASLHPYRARGPRRAILSGYVWCENVLDDGSICGTMMHSGARYAGRRDRRMVRIYRCPTAPPYNTGCGRLSVAAEPVEEIAIGYTQAKLNDQAFMAAVASRRANAGQLAELRHRVDELEARYRELDAELRKVTGRTAAAIAGAMADIDRERDEIRARQARAFAPALPSLDEGWPVDVESQNALVGLAIRRVWIGPNPPPGGRGFNPDRLRIEPTVEVA